MGGNFLGDKSKKRRDLGRWSRGLLVGEVGDAGNPLCEPGDLVGDLAGDLVGEAAGGVGFGANRRKSVITGSCVFN